MLVVTANWAIPDGSVASPPRAAAFTRLLAEMRRAAMRAGVRHDGRYRPIERLAVVLAGDTLDGHVSGLWTGEVRPWHRSRRAAMRREAVLHAAARIGRRPIAALRRLACRGIAVPPADGRGRPMLQAGIVVPVHLVVLVGDRDAALDKIGVQASSTRGAVRFGSIWNGEGVAVAHGSACDPLTAGDDRPTLHESLAVDLLARFGSLLAERAGAAVVMRNVIRVLADGHPLEMPARLGGVLRRLDERGLETAWIAASWRRCVDGWERLARHAGCGDGHGELAAIAGWMHAIGDATAVGPGVRAVVATLSAPLPAAAGGASGQRLTVFGHGPCAGTNTDERVVFVGPPCGPMSGAASLDRSGVACIEATPAIDSDELPAVVVPEADELGSPGMAWRRVGDRGTSASHRPAASFILDAA